jgi:hypothetical protein
VFDDPAVPDPRDLDGCDATLGSRGHMDVQENERAFCCDAEDLLPGSRKPSDKVFEIIYCCRIPKPRL